jgi:phospholipid/cholesterol/gamma-HCH transport system ATP-binding protein
MSIVLSNISKSFGDKHVLKDINHEFLPGRLNMIIGASGSGKSVMVKIILGLMRPDTGTVTIEGVDMHTSHPKVLRNVRRNVGMLFQSSALFSSSTVEENVAFPLQMFTKMSKAEMHDRVLFCLEQVQLPKAAPLMPSELSGGMKKRVALARAIALEPKFLFCDEPNSGLDPKTADTIDELIKKLTHEFNTTTLVITHDMKSVLTHADHIFFIYNGRKEWEGAREELKGMKSEPLLDFLKTSGLLGGQFTHYLPPQPLA